MRFCDLFIKYKIGLKNNKGNIPLKELPRYRKILFGVFLACCIISGILYITLNKHFSSIIFIIVAIPIIIFLIVDSRTSNLKLMLEKHYIPYSNKRMNMIINILNEFNVDIRDLKAIDMLIDEAKYAQNQCDYLLQFKTPLKVVSTIIIPIILIIAERIFRETSINAMLYMCAKTIILILLVYAYVLIFKPIVKYILHGDYNKYEELIYDLKQVKIFYSKKIN